MTKKKKKKNQNKCPRVKKMSRQVRLQSAKHWLAIYNGDNPIRGYKKRYAVSEVCAIIELRLLGVNIYGDRLQKAVQAEEDKAHQRRKQKEAKKQKESEVLYEDSDETFCFIAGYTPGGAPFGITWEEMDKDLIPILTMLD